MVVETIDLSKRYGPFQALKDCSLSVREGEVFGLLGPNGAGKSTFLRLLLGFIRPTSGTARILGLDCVRQSVAVRHKVSYLPGDARLFRGMRGRDCLRFFSDLRPEGDYRRALELAERLELDLSRRIGFMSTGMRQKVALVATLSFRVPLIILDEPTANLDPTVRGAALDLVKEARSDGRTVVFSSHVLSEVEEACDRAAVLRAGELVHVQSLAELATRHRIGLTYSGEPPTIPEEFDAQRLADDDPRRLVFETPTELRRVLQWLASLPLEDVNIERVGLRSVYDKYHQRRPAPSPASEPAAPVAPEPAEVGNG